MSKKALIKGNLVELPRSGTSKDGHDWARFSIRTKSAIYTCIVFAEKAAQAVLDLTQEGIELEVAGYFKDTDAETLKNLTVMSYTLPTKPRSLHEHILKEYGTIEAYKEDRAKQLAAMVQNGYRLVPQRQDNGTIRYVEVPEKFCFEEGGKWYSKIEFACDKLGAKHVSEQLRSVWKDIKQTPPRNPGDRNAPLVRAFSYFPHEALLQMVNLLYTDALQ